MRGEGQRRGKLFNFFITDNYPMGLGEDIKRGFLYGLGFFGAFLVILIVLSLILLVFAIASGSQMSPTPSPTPSPSSGG